MKTSTIFVNKLKRLLDEKGLSARKLSLTAGLSHATVHHVLGGSVPSLDSAVAIANAFGMSLAEFLGETGKEHSIDECFRRVSSEWKKQRSKS